MMLIRDDYSTPTRCNPIHDPPTPMLRPGVPDKEQNMFALEADITVYWPWVRPCWEERC